MKDILSILCWYGGSGVEKIIIYYILISERNVVEKVWQFICKDYILENYDTDATEIVLGRCLQRCNCN